MIVEDEEDISLVVEHHHHGNIISMGLHSEARISAEPAPLELGALFERDHLLSTQVCLDQVMAQQRYHAFYLVR